MQGFRQTFGQGEEDGKRERGNDALIGHFGSFSAKRFLSVADTRNVEARLFNYDGPLKEVSSIRVPILAVFGAKEEHAPKPVNECLDLLREKTKSKSYSQIIIRNAKHSFWDHEDEMASRVAGWVQGLSK